MSTLETTAASVAAATQQTADSGGRSWFAVQTWPKYEKKISQRLQEKGIEVFLPLVTEEHQWSDRCSRIDAPLFPHYVFVSIANSAGARIPVLRITGVAGFVGGRGIGIAIPDSEIASIRTVLSQGIAFHAFPYLNVGSRVRIRGGSLDGVQGILVAKNDDLSLLVSIQIIQRSLAIRVSGYQIEPA